MNRNELYHYGILGMKWGVRRYQDYNGRLTAEGKQRIKDAQLYAKSGGNIAEEHMQKYLKSQLRALGIKPDLQAMYFARKQYDKEFNHVKHADTIDRLKKAGFVEGEYGEFDKELSVTRDNGKHTFKPKLRVYDDGFDELSAEQISKTADYIEKNIKKLDTQFRKDASKEFFSSDNPIDWPWAYQPDGNGVAPFSKEAAIKDFEKHLGTYKLGDDKRKYGDISYVMGYRDNTFQAWYDSGDSYGDHSIVAEYDPKQKKFKYFSVEG